nr:disease resistance protein RPP13-like isoform X6 [Ipomoea batatas]
MYFVWKEISILSSLPKLEVLKLIGCFCNDEEWELSEKEIFKQLTYLEIVTNMFKRWEASNKHFPNLQHLILVGCFKLEEIPVEFGEIVTLKLIKLKHCLPSVVNSAKQIMEEQHDQGNDNMFVIEEGTLKARSSLAVVVWSFTACGSDFLGHLSPVAGVRMMPAMENKRLRPRQRMPALQWRTVLNHPVQIKVQILQQHRNLLHTLSSS